jgi:KDO2-lipid IV(A) lauroyltransferase
VNRHAASVEDLPPPPPETLSQKATYWQYRAVWEAAARLPEPIYWRTPARVGRAWYAAASERQRAQVGANLRRVVGSDVAERELRTLVRDAYVGYARYWLDAFRVHRWEPDEVLGRSSGEGLEHVDAFRRHDEGGILATGHLGAWDVGAFFMSSRDWRGTVVAEVIEPRRLFDRFVQLRRDAGLGVIPLVRGGDMIERLTEVVRDGGVATLLGDRDLTRKGPIVEFFGEPCRLPPGVASLARRTGRPFCAGAFFALPRGWRGVVRPAIDISSLSVEQGTQVVAWELERLIERDPTQWHVFVRNWLADREPDHEVVAAWRAGRWQPPLTDRLLWSPPWADDVVDLRRGA